MNLRRKLVVCFGALALLALIIAAVSVWVTVSWRRSNARLEGHYQRSLLLQRVRAAAFRAFKEVPDAVTGDDTDSRAEFISYIQPAETDFARWAALADTADERAEVEQVRAAFDRLVQDAHQTFDLVDAKRMREAFELMENRLEDQQFIPFQQLTEQAVKSDQQKREHIRAEVAAIRRTAQIVLLIAAFGTLSLALLVAAYITADLSGPLGAVAQALEDVARGDFQQRLEDERGDEIGAINRAFNRMAETLAVRARLGGDAALGAGEAGGASGNGAGRDWRAQPSRLTLHALLTELRGQVARLQNGAGEDAARRKELVAQIEQLTEAVASVAEFGLPLDLNLARTDVRALLYEVLLRFHEEFARRAVSFELNVAPEVTTATVDRLKLRESLAEMIRNALKALPETGGRLGLRASVDEDAQELLIEVADNGSGVEQSVIDRAFTHGRTGRQARPAVGLSMTKAIVEQHGGHFEIASQPDQGTYVQIRLPLRSAAR